MIKAYTDQDFNIRELGCFYEKDRTAFKVFAPFHSHLNLHLNGQVIPMYKKGMVFEQIVYGDFHLARYFYSDGVSGFADPMAYMADEKGSIVLDENHFICETIPMEKAENLAIYECNVRDFSSADSYKGRYKGKFLSFTEKGLKNPEGYPIGLDYLKQLGISHLQLMPILAYDKDRTDYNWGYNPIAYNYVQKDYVYEQNNPYAYINEVRTMVNTLHKEGIRVVLDLVFNHVYDVKKNDLGKMLKGHAYRYKKDGSLAAGTFCGSEVASEDPFIRAYLIEMVERYLRLFDIDGIRFDLMGIMDIETVKEIYKNARRVKKDFIIYGEGWNMGDVLPPKERASIDNAAKLPSIAMFNDHFRETVTAYVSDDLYQREEIKKLLSGRSDYLDSSQSLNYVECHDGYTFTDRMKLDHPQEAELINKRRCKLAISLILIAKGIPFIHAGQEFLRNKKGIRNSYNSPDEINKLDWDLSVKNEDVVSYFRELLQLRKECGAFTAFQKEAFYEDYYECMLIRTSHLMMIINPCAYGHRYNDGKTYQVIFNEKGRCDQKTQTVSICAHSLVICRY